METDGRQTRTILTADRFTGPYTIIRHDLQPLGMNAGDFDLVINPDDGKAYTYFERVHSELICADLTENYTDVTGYYSTHFPHPAPPQVREGPAYFHRRGKHYLITSGTTGYHPNPSEVAIADTSTVHGPYWATCTPRMPRAHPSTRRSVRCSNIRPRRISTLPWPTAGCPTCPRRKARLCQRRCLSPFRADVRQDVQSRRACPHGGGRRGVEGQAEQINTSRGTYVWLPLRFEGDRPLSTGAANGVLTTSPDGGAE
jgi:hypothetical protein